MKVADGVEMLEISSGKMGKTDAIYPVLIWDKEAVILVDTGLPGQLQQIKEAIEKVGISFYKINNIIITHHDIDHIGNISAIMGELHHSADILAHIDEKPYIQGEKCPIKLAQLESNLAELSSDMKNFYEKLKVGFQNCKSKVNITLVNGEKLPYCGGISVIHTPGHTFGHICLYIAQSKTLIAGDTLTVENGILVPAPKSIHYDEDMNLKSLEKLTRYDIEYVVCYHGGLFSDNVNERIKELTKEL